MYLFPDHLGTVRLETYGDGPNAGDMRASTPTTPYSDSAHRHAVTGLSGGDSFSYDANGNMLTRHVGGVLYTLTWDHENRLTGASWPGGSATFVYDHNGERVKATVNGETTIYVGPYYERTGDASTKYYYADGRRVAMRRTGYAADNGLFYLFSDQIGSTTVVANPNGTLHSEMLYKAWGETRYETTPSVPTDFRFTGQREEAELGLYYYGARYYAPYLNQWIQPDTIVPNPGDPQSLNRYSYVLNNPLRFVDPSGHCGPLTPVCIGLVLGGMALLLSGDDTLHQPTQGEINSARLGGALLVTGGGLAGGSAVFGSVRAAATAGTSAACADGNCTNEAQALARTAQNGAEAAQSVWSLDPFRRAQEIERILGRSPQLAQNFPVIDRFENGVATSIKSIDLGAKSYQNIGTLTSTVRGYVSELANWQGVRSWGNFGIGPSDIRARELLLAIPSGATEAQMAALHALQQWATNVGVSVNVTVVP